MLAGVATFSGIGATIIDRDSSPTAAKCAAARPIDGSVLTLPVCDGAVVVRLEGHRSPVDVVAPLIPIAAVLLSVSGGFGIANWQAGRQAEIEALRQRRQDLRDQADGIEREQDQIELGLTASEASLRTARHELERLQAAATAQSSPGAAPASLPIPDASADTPLGSEDRVALLALVALVNQHNHTLSSATAHVAADRRAVLAGVIEAAATLIDACNGELERVGAQLTDTQQHRRVQAMSDANTKREEAIALDRKKFNAWRSSVTP